MQEPLISIIVAVYNVEMYLKRCIDSILAQSYTHLEILLVDDGSTDDSPQICEDYAKKDKRVKVFHKKNEGQSIARNTALDNSTGQYIAFVDSDDYVSPYFIEKLYNSITTHNADIAACEFDMVLESGGKKKKKYIKESGVVGGNDIWQMETTDYYMFCVALWNKLYKSEIWKNLRLKEKKYAEDSFAMTEYVKAAKRIAILNEPLYYYYQRENSEVHNFTVKNLDSAEARFERAFYYQSLGNAELIKNCLYHVLPIMDRAYKTLDFHDEQARGRYDELRKQYKQLYHIGYKKMELSKRGIYCFLYCHSDLLFSLLQKIITGIRQTIKK